MYACLSPFSVRHLGLDFAGIKLYIISQQMMVVILSEWLHSVKSTAELSPGCIFVFVYVSL